MTNSNNNQNTVPTRFTTGKIRLSYAFIWAPRSNTDDSSSDGKEKKYTTSILIPKSDGITINRLNAATQQAYIEGQKKGYWGANAPMKFKLPLRDGDAESSEKGEEYLGNWFLNASSTKPPQIVDINRQDILTESEVYSGCYARAVLRLFPYNNNGNKGIGCGLEVIQKLADGEPLGGVSVDLEAALGDWSDGSGDLPFPGEPGYEDTQGNGYTGQSMQTPNYPQQAQGYPMQQQNYPSQQQGYPIQQQQGYPMQQASGGYQQQGVAGSILPQQPPVYPQQQSGYPQQMPGIPGNMPDYLSAGVEAAGQKIGNVFGDEMKGKVA